MSVVRIEERKLRSADFCFAERPGDGTWPTVAEAWTVADLDEALSPERRAAFLEPMRHFCKIGDRIELFKVMELERPERDPLEMQQLIVADFESDRGGTHLVTVPMGDRLYFGGTGKGVEVVGWNGRQCVFKDGKRMGAYFTRIEAAEHAERLLSPKGRASNEAVKTRVAALSRKPKATKPITPGQRVRREDIAVVGHKKISRIVEVRTLEPLAEVLENPEYFATTTGRFRTGDRVSFLSFESDQRREVVEMLPWALANVESGRVRFYPRGEIITTGRNRETGWKMEEIAEPGTRFKPGPKRIRLRRDGHTVETFDSQDRCDWFCADKGITPQLVKVAA
jgi:hypothetical protein